MGRTGRIRIQLPRGLADSSLLLLRRGDEWLDFRYFCDSGRGRQSDPSVTWDQPDAELGFLVVGGEGQYVEFKQEVPASKESRRTVLKTIAAFASGEGGTLLFGVADDAQVVGVPPAAVDGLRYLTPPENHSDGAADDELRRWPAADSGKGPQTETQPAVPARRRAAGMPRLPGGNFTSRDSYPSAGPSWTRSRELARACRNGFSAKRIAPMWYAGSSARPRTGPTRPHRPAASPRRAVARREPDITAEPTPRDRHPVTNITSLFH